MGIVETPKINESKKIVFYCPSQKRPESVNRRPESANRRPESANRREEYSARR
jgi:hypothetical protein